MTAHSSEPQGTSSAAFCANDKLAVTAHPQLHSVPPTATPAALEPRRDGLPSDAADHHVVQVFALPLRELRRERAVHERLICRTKGRGQGGTGWPMRAERAAVGQARIKRSACGSQVDQEQFAVSSRQDSDHAARGGMRTRPALILVTHAKRPSVRAPKGIGVESERLGVAGCARRKA